jgi:hypothetical protein
MDQYLIGEGKLICINDLIESNIRPPCHPKLISRFLLPFLSTDLA